jgi:AcrR family transcriptional regulator
MARPVMYDTDELLDAAVRLAAESGPAALSMRAVAAAVGAPSGSMYHRFAGRPALLAEVWLRAVAAFQTGYVDALNTADPLTAAVAAARHIVEWSRANPAYTAILSYSPADFGSADWPDEAMARLEATNRRTLRAVRALARRLGATNKADVDRVTVVVLDLPYGLVRRHLRSGRIPRHATALVEHCARAILSPS